MKRFVQHPREQGEWLRQNLRYARVLTASFALLPRVLDEQHPHSPVIIPSPSMNKQSHVQENVGWNSLFAPKIQHSTSLRMYK